jgi:hypothetical protein
VSDTGGGVYIYDASERLYQSTQDDWHRMASRLGDMRQAYDDVQAVNRAATATQHHHVVDVSAAWKLDRSTFYRASPAVA